MIVNLSCMIYYQKIQTLIKNRACVAYVDGFKRSIMKRAMLFLKNLHLNDQFLRNGGQSKI